MTLWVIVASLVSAGCVIDVVRDRQRELNATEGRSRILLELAKAQTARTLEGVEMAIGTAAIVIGESSDWDRRARDPIMWRIFHDVGKSLPSAPRLIAVGPDGTVRINGEDFDSRPISVADRDYFQHHRNSGSNRPYVGDLIVGRFSKTLALTVSIPLARRDGSFGGIVAANLAPEAILGHSIRLIETEGTVFYLVRQDGTLLLHHPPIPGQAGRHVPLAELVGESGVPGGTIRGVSPIDGIEYVFSFERLEHFGLVLISGVPVDQALAPWRERTFRMAAATALAGGALTVLYVILVRRRRERLRSDAVIRESRALLLEVQGVANLGYYVYDMVTDRWDSSEILDKIFGIGPDHPRDATGWLDLVVPDQRDEMAAYLSGIVAGPHDFDKEYRIRRKTDGMERWVAGLGKVERDKEGRGVRMIGTIRDITETMRIQQELSSKAEELARSNADLEQFAYVASHDLREPLRMVNAYVSLLDRRYGDRFDDEAREFLAFAREGATRMDALVLDLLAYSRIGRVIDSAVPLPLGQAVEAAIRHLSGKIDAAAARVEVAPDLPIVTGRVSEMIRLFQNLIDNALKYRSPDRPPVIRISWRATDSQWIVTVADNGLGIAPEYFDRIFVIFQRLHRQPEYEGTGIGLAICKKIVEQHGGSIGLESRVGDGSAFHVSLPRTGAPSAGQNKGRPLQ